MRTARFAHGIVASIVALGPAGCGGGEPAQRPLLVWAAADLQWALPEIAAEYRERTGVPVEIVLGSSGNLATQIEQGGPADLYFSANRAFVDRLEARGHILPGSVRAYAVGRLALVVPPGRVPPAGIDDLVDPLFSVVAIANPEHAPYGVAAREALQAAGIWGTVAPRLVLGENVAQTAQFVQTGNADAGIIALGVALGTSGWNYRLLDADLHNPLVQAAGIVSGSELAEAAEAFIAHVIGPEGQAILARYGFDPPEG